ncbi:MAG: type II secretion system F family protein [Gemmatimonadota bacterium]|nr:type II secretion system F family protein [Gemmatimonadota bacterium]
MLLYVVVASIALAAGLVVLLLGLGVSTEGRMVKRRLAEIGVGADGSAARRSRVIERHKVETLVKALGKKVVDRTKDTSRVRRRLLEAGYRDPQAVTIFQGLRVLLPLVFGFGVLIVTPIFGAPRAMAVLGMFWGFALGWVTPGWIVGRRAKKRQHEIQNTLADALDILVVCVEAGLGLNQALLRVAIEIGHVSPVLAEELGHTNLQIRAGTARQDALKDLGIRTGVDDVHALVTMMIQTERFGTSIAHALRVHADTLREKRRQRAEERAAKTAVKMIFPLAFCIFPSMFIVILGPAFISILRSLALI